MVPPVPITAALRLLPTLNAEEPLTEVIEKYARREKEPSFGVLRRDLDDETFATLIQRKRPPGQQAYHYVAVIDCRGEKSARRFFTRWHEIAHVLTLVGQLELPLHRSTVRKDPVERMMDLIAGDIGFFEPLFQPVLDAECASERGLSFAAVENVRATFCPSASLEATLHACVNKFASPVILLQAAFGHRAEVQRLLASGQGDLFSGDPPAPQLRVPISTGNPAARAARLIIPKNMRVPAGCVIATAMREAQDHAVLRAVEDLNLWRTSSGQALSHARVRIEALKIRDRVWAIVSFC